MFSVKVIRAMSIFVVFVLFSVVLVQDVSFAAPGDLNQKLSAAQTNVFKFIKTIAWYVAILAVAIGGFILLFRSGQPDSMRWLKTAALVLVAALAVIFLAEPIVRTIWGFFGEKPPAGN